MGVLVFGPAQVKVEADPQDLLEHLDTPALLEPTLTGTLPSDDREEYLACVDELNESIHFLEKHAGQLACCKEELENGRRIMEEAVHRLREDFGTLLATSTVSLDKGRHFSILSRRTASGNLAADAAAAGLPQQQPSDTAAGHGSGGGGSSDDHHHPSLVHGQSAVGLLAQPEAMEDLASVCSRLASNGAAATCSEEYLKQRREWQDKTMEAMEMLQLLGVDVMTMAWERLEEAMAMWNDHLKMVERLTVMEADLASRALYPLDSSGSAAKRCVARLALQWLHPLAVFGRVVAESKKTPEKLVPLLDMVESLTDVQPGILLAVEGAPEQDLSEVKSVLAELEQTLKQSARQTAQEFTRVIETDDVGGANSHSQQPQQSSQQATSQQQQQQQNAQQQQQEENQEQQQQQQQWRIPKTPKIFPFIRGRNVQRLEEAAREAAQAAQTPSSAFSAVPADGDVLKIVRYVSNFVWLLGHKEYVSMLRDVMGSDGAVRGWMVATMTALEKNLSVKANTIQDERLRELFLMNNYNYIVCKLDGQEAEDLLSEDWWEGMKQALERHRDKYIEIITNKFDQVLGSGPSDASGFWKRLQAFNVAFDELCQRQRSWRIPNAELCCLIRFEVANVIDLRYKEFIDAHRSVIDSTRRPKAKIHTLTDLGSRLRESFPDRSSSTLSKRTSAP